MSYYAKDFYIKDIVSIELVTSYHAIKNINLFSQFFHFAIFKKGLLIHFKCDRNYFLAFSDSESTRDDIIEIKRQTLAESVKLETDANVDKKEDAA